MFSCWCHSLYRIKWINSEILCHNFILCPSTGLYGSRLLSPLYKLLADSCWYSYWSKLTVLTHDHLIMSYNFGQWLCLSLWYIPILTSFHQCIHSDDFSKVGASCDCLCCCSLIRETDAPYLTPSGEFIHLLPVSAWCINWLVKILQKVCLCCVWFLHVHYVCFSLTCVGDFDLLQQTLAIWSFILHE